MDQSKNIARLPVRRSLPDCIAVTHAALLASASWLQAPSTSVRRQPVTMPATLQSPRWSASERRRACHACDLESGAAVLAAEVVEAPAALQLACQIWTEISCKARPVLCSCQIMYAQQVCLGSDRKAGPGPVRLARAAKVGHLMAESSFRGTTRKRWSPSASGTRKAAHSAFRTHVLSSVCWAHAPATNSKTKASETCFISPVTRSAALCVCCPLHFQ